MKKDGNVGRRNSCCSRCVRLLSGIINFVPDARMLSQTDARKQYPQTPHDEHKALFEDFPFVLQRAWFRRRKATSKSPDEASSRSTQPSNDNQSPVTAPAAPVSPLNTSFPSPMPAPPFSPATSHPTVVDAPACTTLDDPNGSNDGESEVPERSSSPEGCRTLSAVVAQPLRKSTRRTVTVSKDGSRRFLQHKWGTVVEYTLGKFTYCDLIPPPLNTEVVSRCVDSLSIRY